MTLKMNDMVTRIGALSTTKAAGRGSSLSALMLESSLRAAADISTPRRVTVNSGSSPRAGLSTFSRPDEEAMSLGKRGV